MNGTAGSLALLEARPSKNARLVDKLIEAGLIILGKANLSELSNFRGILLPSGWSAVGGQAQSAYVRGGVQPDDSKDGHSSPSGSSSGPAVVVSAGYAPLSVGTETDGSLVVPANRAAVYTIKPTIGLVSQDGLIPVCHTMDAAGPIARTPYDLAALLDVMHERESNGAPYTSMLDDTWSGLSVGALNYKEWLFPPQFMKPVESATAQMFDAFEAAYTKIESQAGKFVANFPLRSPDEFELNGQNSQLVIMRAYRLAESDFRVDFQRYLSDLEYRPIQDLQALIGFKLALSDEELPPGHEDQQLLIDAAGLNLSSAEYDVYLQHLRSIARTKGADHIFAKYGVDVIIGPADSVLSKVAAGAGYPIATMLVSYLDYNGRAFGMVAMAAAHQEATLFKVMGAWDKIFDPVKPPPMLGESSSGT